MGTDAFSRIPDYLKVYVVEQNYEKYTPQDQAAWRFIMRLSRDYFSKHAHPIYLKGLEETGIPITQIPNVKEMDEKLSKFGWGALCITGFIPSAAFLDFLANKILPIAADMRTVDHIHYTPAPDIVHEAAGHAPIIADKDYRDYLSRYAFLARKAIYSFEDINVYEAIRLLSDLKENPDASKEQIADAEKHLTNTVNNVSWVTESAKVLRMSWWTTEYGLMGPLDSQNPEDLKIYGAGLLSSVGESADVYSDKVKRIPLSLDCVDMGIDITEPQPQLYIAKDVSHLNEVLDELENQMCFRIGGLSSVKEALRAKTVTTTVLDSGVQLSGIVADFIEKDGDPIFVKWSSKCQIAVDDSELENQGVKRHPEGFSSPIGRWKGIDKSPSDLSKDELNENGFSEGKVVAFEFESGIKVSGRLEKLVFENGKLVVLTLNDAASNYGDKVLYEPSWGPFDMLVGETITSVFGGPADWNLYGDYNIGKISTQPGRTTPFTSEEKELFNLYLTVRNIRESGFNENHIDKILDVGEKLLASNKDEWLLAMEICELEAQSEVSNATLSAQVEMLKSKVLLPEKYNLDIQSMIQRGLKLISVRD